MIAELTIRRTIGDLLRERFGYPIYGNEVREGFKRPAFFVYLKENALEYPTQNVCRRRIRVKIHYFMKTADEVESMEMADNLKRLFGMALPVESRKLLLSQIENEQIGEREDILLFSFLLEFYDKPYHLDNLPQYETMETLVMSRKKGE